MLTVLLLQASLALAPTPPSSGLVCSDFSERFLWCQSTAEQIVGAGHWVAKTEKPESGRATKVFTAPKVDQGPLFSQRTAPPPPLWGLSSAVTFRQPKMRVVLLIPNDDGSWNVTLTGDNFSGSYDIRCPKPEDPPWKLGVYSEGKKAFTVTLECPEKELTKPSP